MLTSVVFANIYTGCAAAEFSLVSIFDLFDDLGGQLRDQVGVNAPSMGDGKIVKINLFRADLEFNPIALGNLEKIFCQPEYFVFLRTAHG